jgi:nucleoside diphosphate-linked moiety X motif protein 19
MIHSKSKSFLELCEEHQIIPDIWNVWEWNTWLTPTTLKRRYETAFYLVALNSIPEIHPENEFEVEEYMVSGLLVI